MLHTSAAVADGNLHLGEASSGPGESGQPTALIVDDVAVNRVVLRRLLQQVRGAAGGKGVGKNELGWSGPQRPGLGQAPGGARAAPRQGAWQSARPAWALPSAFR
jgi:hypothetical protein